MRGGISQFLILFWQWISINAFVGPQESAWLLKNTFGSCEWFQNVYELGVFGGEPAQHGLVAQNLHFLAHTDYANGSRLFTLEYPHVLIISATIVCASRALLIDHYSTLTLRIQYSCRGVACGQEPSDVKYRQYTHLFSFACTVDGTRYTTLDHFMKHPYINRSEQLIDDHGSGVLTSYPCRLCSVDPNIRNSPHTGPRFRPETGCVGKCRKNFETSRSHPPSPLLTATHTHAHLWLQSRSHDPSENQQIVAIIVLVTLISYMFATEVTKKWLKC